MQANPCRHVKIIGPTHSSAGVAYRLYERRRYRGGRLCSRDRRLEKPRYPA